VEATLESLPALALALILSLAFGRLASRIGLPRVTVYLLVGFALGPEAFGALVAPDAVVAPFLLGAQSIAPLAAIEQIAIGAILFGVGGEFRFPSFRRLGPRALGLSAVEISLTGVLVGLAVLFGTGQWQLAVIAPALAIASAPSATLVTLREVEAEGPTSRALMLCVGHNNLAALLLFPLLLSLAFGAGSPGAATALAVAALIGGGSLGLAASVGLEAIAGRRELVLLGLLLVLLILGGVHWLAPGSTGLAMLGCFAAGVAVANGSPHANNLFRYLENTVYPLYVLFFIGAGRDLHLGALHAAGVLGLLFVAARTTGKLLGARLGLRMVGWEGELSPALGAGLLCQAGVALGFVAALEQVTPEATAELREVVVASVVVFELVGPWLVRSTVVRAGEVKLANLLSHPDATGPDAVRWVLLELRRNLGLVKSTGLDASDGPRVRHAMQRRPDTVRETAPFDRILKALSESGAEILPVVDAENRLLGLISYDEVKNTLYDPALRDLVIAGDLSESVDDPLAPDESLAAALERMDRHRVHCWPVVEDGRLAGVMRRADLYSLLRGSAPRASSSKRT